MKDVEACAMNLCDKEGCDNPATRMFYSGSPKDRHFTCDDCGDEPTMSFMFETGRPENEPLRECRLGDAIKSMRKQNVKLGNLSPQRYAALCRWHPEW